MCLHGIGTGSPKSYDVPKIHKTNILPRPIVSSSNTMTYAVAKELARILIPVTGKSSHHVENIQNFVKKHEEH